MDLIYAALTGALVGWMAGHIMKGRGFGCLGNVMVGILGAVLGFFLFKFTCIEIDGFLGEILRSLIGACILCALLGIKKQDD